MDCSCDASVDYDCDGPAFFSEYMRKARTIHRCTGCGRVIASKEVYEYVSGLWDGDFCVFKTCKDCLSMRKEFFKTFTYTAIWHDLREYVNNCDGGVPEQCIASLTPVSRSAVAEMIDMYFARRSRHETTS